MPHRQTVHLATKMYLLVSGMALDSPVIVTKAPIIPNLANSSPTNPVKIRFTVRMYAKQCNHGLQYASLSFKVNAYVASEAVLPSKMSLGQIKLVHARKVSWLALLRQLKSTPCVIPILVSQLKSVQSLT